MEWYPLWLDTVTDCIFIGQTQSEINFDALHEIDNSSEEELLLMPLETSFPGQTMPYRLTSYKGGFKTGTKQQHTSSFDKHFEKNLSKERVTELANQFKTERSGR